MMIMKKILVAILCLACVSSYAQRRRNNKPAANPPAAQQQQQPTTANPNNPVKLGNPNGAAPNGGVRATPTDTSKRKPFEAPLDGYFKKSNFLSARVTPYRYLRESVAGFVMRIWRVMFVRE